MFPDFPAGGAGQAMEQTPHSGGSPRQQMEGIAMEHGLQHGALDPEALHLCIDMQDLFGPASPWAVPWMENVLPTVADLAAAHPERTVFTRFVPPRRLGDAVGAWLGYYAHWSQMLRDNLDPDRLGLRAPLRDLVPPARLFERPVYSPWGDGRLHATLREDRVSTLIMTGGETDICVLASVMGAVDHGYWVVVVADGVCSSTDAGHDAAMTFYLGRLGHQIEVASAAEVAQAWCP